MSNEKEELEKQLQSIKNNLEKKLSEVKNSSKKQSKKNINSKENGLPKNRKKQIPIKVDMEVIPVADTPTLKDKKKIKKSNVPNTTIPQIKKGKKKKQLPVLPIILLVILLGSLAYVYSLKKSLKEEKSQFEKDKAESIDYKEDVYFKEVEDEVDDEEMQDFAVYKDVPEVVAKNNSKSKILSASDEKVINQQISRKEANKKNNSKLVKNDSKSKAEKSNKQTIINSDITTQPNKTTVTETKKATIYSDMIQVIGLEHKDGNFTLPKKIKRTNAFKIRIRLKKNQLNSSDEDNEIMLVIKNSNGKTIKIDSKKINFKKQNSKVLNLEFYEIFSERLKINTNYSFSIFADRKLIKSYRKSI